MANIPRYDQTPSRPTRYTQAGFRTTTRQPASCGSPSKGHNHECGTMTRPRRMTLALPARMTGAPYRYKLSIHPNPPFSGEMQRVALPTPADGCNPVTVIQDAGSAGKVSPAGGHRSAGKRRSAGSPPSVSLHLYMRSKWRHFSPCDDRRYRLAHGWFSMFALVYRNARLAVKRHTVLCHRRYGLPA